jgi:uncharacterized membrane protein YhaH (DUF805 family)
MRHADPGESEAHMSTPDGQQEPYGPNPYQPSPKPSQAPGGQGTYNPEDDIPRQQAPRDDQYGAPGQGQYGPGQDAGRAGGQQGAYNAYPTGGGYAPGGGYPPPGGPGPLSYLQGAPVGFGEAIMGAMGNMVTLRGRASRSAFWWFALLQVIAYLVVGFVSDASRTAGIVLDIVIGIPLVIAGISLAVRRLHDTNRTGWWWWIGFIPIIGGIILLVFYLLRGTPGPNRYSVAR